MVERLAKLASYVALANLLTLAALTYYVTFTLGGIEMRCIDLEVNFDSLRKASNALQLSIFNASGVLVFIPWLSWVAMEANQMWMHTSQSHSDAS